MTDKRWNYIDVLRVLSLLLIILYHYELDIEASGLFSLQSAGIRFENANIHIAKVGVALFFMISGFGLMYGSYNQFSLKSFIRKRFWRICIPFYVVSLLAYLSKKILVSKVVFENNIPKGNIIFTILGIDGYVEEYGIPTFSLGIGEWFLGCLILMYLCFPLLRKWMKKNVNVMMIVTTLCYIMIAAVYQGEVPAHYFFFIKIYDFILGMFMAVKLRKNSLKYLIPLIPMALFLIVFPYRIPMNNNYVITIFCVLIFLIAFHMEDLKIMNAISCSRSMKMLSKYSYEMFLIHHWGLILMNKVLRPQSILMVAICFVIEFVIISIGGMLLKKGIMKMQQFVESKAARLR